jgi:diaminopimelate epimerase
MSDQIFYTEGAKNSFFLTFSTQLGFEDLKAKALDLGLDPDGYILAPKTSENEADFNFYNKDSSLVDFCGNALRATGLCFFDQFGQKSLKLKTAVGPMSVEVLSKEVIKAQMPSPKSYGFLAIEDLKANYILAGVPHLVFSLSEMGLNFEDKAKIKEFCHRVRQMSLGESRETFNLTFYTLEDDLVHCVSFERGVEDFTEACGSGALSAFVALGEKFSNIKMPGGLLNIYKDVETYYMKGPATIIKRIKP